jgi:hypothetical protein
MQAPSVANLCACCDQYQASVGVLIALGNRSIIGIGGFGDRHNPISGQYGHPSAASIEGETVLLKS